jgi:hypothetical protein
MVREAAALEIPVGVGAYGTLILAHQGMRHVEDFGYPRDVDDSIRYDPVTGGMGFFADYRFVDLIKRAALHHSLDVGLELFFVFPRVNKYGSSSCPQCETDVFFALNARVRFPINLTPLVAPYPLFSFGLSNITDRREGQGATNYTGVDVTLGAGVEFNPIRYCNPFLELRYLFGSGWDKNVSGSLETKTRIYYHAFLINIGIRFL